MNNRIKAIVWAGLLAGVLDGLAAALLFFFRTGKDPLIVYRFIASGVFGPDAQAGGLTMGIVGIIFHLIIAMGWTVVFFVACEKIPVLLKQPVLSGVSYGVFVWLMMNLVVIPLSRVAAQPITLNGALIGASVLIVCIGLPISLLASKYYRGLKS